MHTVRAVLLFSILISILFLPTQNARTQEEIGQFLRLSSGSVYLEYARYSDKDRKTVQETTWVYIGSGWAYKNVDDGSIWITNAHVVEMNPNRVDEKGRWWFPTGDYGVRMQGKFIVRAKLLKVDKESDLAALKAEVKATPVSCVDTADPPVGAPVVVVGSPISIRQAVSYGRVMRENSEEYDYDGISGFAGAVEGQYKGGHLWLDVRVTHGNSGSLVANGVTGCVVGVIRGYWSAGTFVQLGEPIIYAIPSATLNNFLSKL